MHLTDAGPSAAALAFFEPSTLAQTPLRRAITAATRRPEPLAMAALLPDARLPVAQAQHTQALATRLAQALRTRQASAGRAGLVQSLLQEYSLSSQEGVALMCMAEALLRIPDAPTRDRLIRDKIGAGQWSAHLGRSGSLFVNATTWGLLLTGKLVATHSQAGLSAALGRLLSRGGEPLIRKAVDAALRLMGQQFVTGQHIGEALAHAQVQERLGFRHSFDMLGEAAMTAADARRYLRDYEDAIQAIGQASAGRGVYAGPGISIKLSALHPRYSRAQQARVMAELYPVLLRLSTLARQADIGLNIDAEEADRLELSLDLLERLCFEPALQGWQGLGFVAQAYQKRCPQVIDHLVDLARRSQRRLMVRLVKGAYWDSEIKRAQIDGLADYPVYTRKPHTDAAYLACARRLLAAPQAVYPQFATHNAHTLAAIHEMADPPRYTPQQYEFQCLHGMGEPLYEQVVGAVAQGGLGRPCRIYAPVGTHETLLAYLVRRLLENGANTSFVHRIADPNLPIADLVRDPLDLIDTMARAEGAAGLPHPALPLPGALYGPARGNSQGVDLADEQQLHALAQGLREAARQPLPQAAPLLAVQTAERPLHAVLNPADRRDQVGLTRECSDAELEAALAQAQAAAPPWARTPASARAQALEAAAQRLQDDLPRLLALLMREAGKTATNATGEVREAVDFLRYYAHQVRTGFDPASHRPLGAVACISPWNFPLAIFVGQVAAALAAGNVVLAKPAEQTPLIAAEAVRALWAAGVPRGALQLLPGRGEVVGARLVADARIAGVLFTGSTEVARSIQRTLAGRVSAQGGAIPLVAETGGQNAMIVDSTALAEQVVADVLASAFDSAGQRCSALRVLCLQDEVAERVLQMLLGAMAELRLGPPGQLATDVGPVIDRQAQALIEAHVEAMRARGRRVHQVCAVSEHALEQGHFVKPAVIEIDSLDDLQREVFGPVLHVLRYRREDLDALLRQINATGYGLTLGLHTRIDETIAQVIKTAQVGNVYVNRSMVGAVVGVQPFGGEGLSGTGPKAGGPLYLYRLLSAKPPGVLARLGVVGVPAAGGDGDAAAMLAHAQPQALPPSHGDAHTPAGALQALMQWAAGRCPGLPEVCRQMAAWAGPALNAAPAAAGFTDAPGWQELPGPTGERNLYRVVPRAGVLCLADAPQDRLVQLAAVLAVGSRAVWPAPAAPLFEDLPAQVQAQVTLVDDGPAGAVATARFDAVLLHGSVEDLVRVQQQLAQRPGPVLSVERLAPGDPAVPLERLVVERALSLNTAAAGGNASLMMMA